MDNMPRVVAYLLAKEGVARLGRDEPAPTGVTINMLKSTLPKPAVDPDPSGDASEGFDWYTALYKEPVQSEPYNITGSVQPIPPITKQITIYPTGSWRTANPRYLLDYPSFQVRLRGGTGARSHSCRQFGRDEVRVGTADKATKVILLRM